MLTRFTDHFAMYINITSNLVVCTSETNMSTICQLKKLYEKF